MPIFTHRAVGKKVGICLLAAGILLPTLTHAGIFPQSNNAAILTSAKLNPMTEALRQYAVKEWGVPENARVVQAELINCQGVLNYACTQGQKVWQMTLEAQNKRWVFVANADGSNKQLTERENLALKAEKIPSQVLDAVLEAAANSGFYVSPTQVERFMPNQLMITEVKPATWKNTCLIPYPGESCQEKTTQGWRLTVEGKPGKNLYYMTDNLGKVVKPDIDSNIVPAVLEKATKEWGLPSTGWRILNAEKIDWSFGCENPPPFPIMGCDPVVMSGWALTIGNNNTQTWKFRVDNHGSNPELLARDNFAPLISAAVPVFSETIIKKVQQLAAAHLQIKPPQVLITQANRAVWQDSCLGLGSTFERCPKAQSPGWQVQVAGKRGQTQVYRIAADGKLLRTEASNGLPPRTDDLPNNIAQSVFQTASSRLKTPVANLRITKAEKIQRKQCIRTPTDPPNAPCRATILVDDGWRVQVRNSTRQLVYNLDFLGHVRKS